MDDRLEGKIPIFLNRYDPYMDHYLSTFTIKIGQVLVNILSMDALDNVFFSYSIQSVGA